MNAKTYQESGHYYDRLGNPCYEQPLKKDPSRFRSTNINDMVEQDLVISVTTAIKQTIKNIRLEIYRENQLTDAFLGMKRVDKEEDEYYVHRVKLQARKHAKEAMEGGSHIHAFNERYLLSIMKKEKMEIFSKKEEAYLKQFKSFWDQTSLVPLEVEKIVINNIMDYGGKIDLVARSIKKNKIVILDWKTKKFKDGKAEFYRDWGLQLAAYSEAYNNKLDNVLISVVMDREEPLMAWKIWDDPVELFKEFLHCMELWKSPLISNYTKRREKWLKKQNGGKHEK